MELDESRMFFSAEGAGEAIQRTGELVGNAFAPVLGATVGAAMEVGSALGGSSYAEDGRTRSYYMMEIENVVRMADFKHVSKEVLMGGEAVLISLRAEFESRGSSTYAKTFGSNELKGKLEAFAEVLKANYAEVRFREEKIEAREAEIEAETRRRDAEIEAETRRRDAEIEAETRRRDAEIEAEMRRVKIIERHNADFEPFLRTFTAHMSVVNFEDMMKIRGVYDQQLIIKLAGVISVPQGYAGGGPQGLG